MEIRRWILDNLKKDAIIIEAGSYDGNDTIFLADLANQGKVYSFEPIPQLYQNCTVRCKEKHNVKIFQKALGDKDELRKMYLSDRFGVPWGSSSLLKPKEHLEVHPQITFNSELNIECVKIDTFCEKEKIEKIDFMWLDLQGYEPLVLFSSKKMLLNTKYIYTEVSLIETYENVMIYPEFKKQMISYGFEIIFEDLPWNDMGNVLFKNKNIQDEF